MNEETAAILKAIVAKIDSNVRLTKPELEIISDTLKHLMPLALSVDGNYQEAREVKAQYGIH